MTEQEAFNKYRDICNFALKLSQSDLDKRLELIYQWIKVGNISFKEYQILVNDFIIGAKHE